MKATRIITPLAMMGLVAAVAGGCTAGQQVTAADIVQKMRETMKTTTSVQSTVDLSLTINKDGISAMLGTMMPSGMQANPGAGMGMGKGGMMNGDWASSLPESVSATLNYWKQSTDKVRVEVTDSSIAEIKGGTVVYDGQKVYALDAKNNTVYTLTPSKHIDQIPAEMKAAMANLDIEKELDKVIAASDIKLSGTEKIAGVDAYKLDVTPRAGAADTLDIPQAFKMQAGIMIKDLHATIWVDKDRWIPVKFTLEHPNIGSFTYAASKLDINKSIDAATFVLQVPAGAKTVDLDAVAEQMQPKQITLTEARDAAQKQGWQLLVPGYLPDGATLVGVTQMQKMMGEGFMLSYSAASTDFTVMEAKGSMPNMLGDNFSGVNGSAPGASDAYKEVTVRGVQAKALSPTGSNWTALIWQEKGSGIWVGIRGNLTVDEAVKIAEGLK